MRNKFNKIFALVFMFTLVSLFVLLASSCSIFSGNSLEKAMKNEAAVVAADMDSSAVVMSAAPRMAKMSSTAAVYSDDHGENFSAGTIESESGALSDEVPERKLIRTGDISLEVLSLDAAEKAIGEWAGKFSGYIESSYSSESDGNVTVRIPSARFDEAMAEIGELGRVKSQSISSEDVTERFYDLKTRLEAKKVMRSRLQDYLSKAKDIKDMLQIERELNSVMADIERMEGSMRRLSSQVDYSSVSVRYSLPYRADPDGGSFMWPDLGDGFRRFVASIVDFFVGFVKVVLYIVICGIPVLAFAALLFWLLFGKVGLVRKIFSRLK